jgi:HPt (histidine-containing phosphotransfer) domain-containing protein
VSAHAISIEVDLDGQLRSDATALAPWFEVASGAPVWTWLFAHAPEQQAWIELGFSTLATRVIPADIVLGQLPSRLDRGDQIFRLEFSAVGDPIRGVMLAVEDITASDRQERKDRAERDRAVMRTASDEVVRDLDALVAAAIDPALAATEVLRVVHRIKGDAGMVGLAGLSTLGRALERELLERSTGLDDAERDRLRAAWQELRGCRES